MRRVTADLPNEDARWLAETAVVLGRSRASLLREAVAFFRGVPKSEADLAWIEQGFAAWKDRADIGDGLGLQRRERAASTRPWDNDYEMTKAEFPDLFDEEDDRQRRMFLDMIARNSSESGGKDANCR